MIKPMQSNRARFAFCAVLSFGLSAVCISIPCAQQRDLYASENKFAMDFLKDTSLSGLPSELDWDALPDIIKTGFRYDLRKKYDGNLPSGRIADEEKLELTKTFRERVFVDFVSKKANPGDVGAIVQKPPTMEIKLDPKVVSSLTQVFPFEKSVDARIQELAGETSEPLVLSRSGYESSPGHYVANPKVPDSGPSKRPVIVDPLGFSEAALFLRDPTLNADKTLSVVRCSAVLVAPDWLVTARHCVGDPKDKRVATTSPEFVIDKNLINTETSDGRGFVFVQKSIIDLKDSAARLKEYDKLTQKYASLGNCLTGVGALTISDDPECPYFAAYIVAIEVPSAETCVTTVEGPCGMIRPDIALVKVEWKTKPNVAPLGIAPETGKALIDRLTAYGGVTFAGYGISVGANGALTSRSPLVIGFHAGSVSIQGNDIRTEYQWVQDLGEGKDGLCGGDSGGPIYAGLKRGHRQTAQVQVFALMSRISPPGASSIAVASTGQPTCYRGKINVVALQPWRTWICTTSANTMDGCSK